jgi:very-short-patch-repair endonuclease
LLRLPAEARVEVRWRGQSLERLDSTTADRVQELLVEVGGMEGLLLGTDASPWTNSSIPDTKVAAHAIDLASELVHVAGPSALRALDGLARVGFGIPDTLQDAISAVTLVFDVARLLGRYDEALFSEDLEALAVALDPDTRGPLMSLWAWCTSPTYRSARQSVRGHLRQGSSPLSSLALDVQRARDLESQLTKPGIVRVSQVEGIEGARDSLNTLAGQITSLQAVLGRADLMGLPLGELGALLAGLDKDRQTPYRLARLSELIVDVEQHAPGLLNEVRALRRPAILWPSMFRQAWMSSCLQAAYTEDSAIAGFSGRAHEVFVQEFDDLDRARLALATRRVRRRHAERVIDAMNAHPDQALLVRREVAKRARHIPLRKLLAEAPDVLTALFPCWMASPLAVSQLVGTDRQYFDIVLFDEASQVLPEDAVAALLRAKRAVVAGDRNQLPPTMFFAAGDDEQGLSEEASGTEGFESLLDVMAGLVEPWSLNWHYRSKDERLIAFSNHSIYGDRLVTFPSARSEPPPVRHLLVPSDETDVDTQSSTMEIQNVIDCILAHAEAQVARPSADRETLGVIALGIRHADRIQAALDPARSARPDLDDFFDEHKPERFFIKNLERVQGDERDAIILSLGVSKGRGGRLDHRAFGPLNGDAGRRRLNVAITRARRRMTLVSSFTHIDLDPEHGSEGVRLLRDYLLYTASGGTVYGDGRVGATPLNPFEADVADTLERAGIPVIPQWGASGYRIDLVAKHPDRPGEFVLAIECDGASYHSCHTARDRDRLRQQQLEALGWRFHRIWSTDWFQRKDDEVQRALAAYRAAIQTRRGETTGTLNPDPDAPRVASSVEGDEPPERGPRPALRAMAHPARWGQQNRSINDYNHQDLVDLAKWVKSDRRLRTDDEILNEMLSALPFRRRGKRIVDRLRSALADAR